VALAHPVASLQGIEPAGKLSQSPNQFRGLRSATRYEKTARSSMSFLFLAATFDWIGN